MAIQEVLVSKIFNYTSEPTKKVEGQFWFNPSTNILSRYNGTAWKAITVSSDDVAVLSDGNKISLTNYLNTQIAALAEGIDTKQDKLTYYKEDSEQSWASIHGCNDFIVYSSDHASFKAKNTIGIFTDADALESSIQLGTNDQSIRLFSGDDEGTEGSIALDGNITGTGIATSIGSYDMSSTKKLPTEHAVAEALVAKQDKLNFYSEKGKDYLSEYTEAKLSNVANITLDAVNIDGGSNIKLISTSAADVPGYLTLQANCSVSDSPAKIYLDSGNSATAASITIDGELKGSSISTSIPANGAAVDTKIVSEKAVKTELDKKQDKLITYSENAETGDVRIDGNSIQLNSSNISLNGGLQGEAIVTSLATTSFASDVKIPSEKAIVTALANKQDSLNHYSETGDNVNVSVINGKSITLQAESGEAIYTNTALTLTDRKLSIDANDIKQISNHNLLTIAIDDSTANITALSGDIITTLINSKDTQLPTSKAVKTELDKKQDILQTYSEVESNAATIATNGAITLSCPGTIKLASTTNVEGKLSVDGNLELTTGSLIRDGIDLVTSLTDEINTKQDKEDNTLETSAKTIVGAINEINSAIINPSTLPTPITDTKTITTTLENLITDTQYANKPGTILINPNIKNTGAILVGEAITDISKAFPIYTDQPITIAFKNINDFKVAGDNAGESFNYIISFGYINIPTSTNA